MGRGEQAPATPDSRRADDALDPYRKAIFGALEPQLRGDLRVERMTRYRSAHSGTSRPQVAAIELVAAFAAGGLAREDGRGEEPRTGRHRDRSVRPGWRPRPAPRARSAHRRDRASRTWLQLRQSQQLVREQPLVHEPAARMRRIRLGLRVSLGLALRRLLPAVASRGPEPMPRRPPRSDVRDIHLALRRFREYQVRFPLLPGMQPPASHSEDQWNEEMGVGPVPPSRPARTAPPRGRAAEGSGR